MGCRSMADLNQQIVKLQAHEIQTLEAYNEYELYKKSDEPHHHKPNGSPDRDFVEFCNKLIIGCERITNKQVSGKGA